MTGTDDLQMALDAIDPAALDYDSWLRVGMACAHEGLPLSAWESWSRRDGARFHEGECARKWAGFRGSASPVTGRTIYRIARDQGNWPPLGWDSDHELYTALDGAHAAWPDEDAERWLDLQCSSLAEEWDATEEEIAARQAAIDALEDALRLKYPSSEHERQSTKDAQERDLPPLVPFSSVMDDLPELAPELIAGILRQGHKMTLAGPSKAGKSFALIGLAVAIAEGREWLGWKCARGPVVYVNLEVDPSSFLRRVSDVYGALGWPREHADDLYAWNLRGHSCDIAALADDLVSIVAKVQPRAIILDPAYKLNDGDENAARDMARFTRSLDEIATRSAASVIICHHHSKGSQGGKASRDRASGSGVIARDADALVDLIELDKPGARERFFERLSIQRMTAVLDADVSGWRETHGAAADDADELRTACRELLDNGVMNALIAELDALEHRTRFARPLEVSPTLREFADGYTQRVWYMCPVHVPAGDELADARADGATPAKRTPAEYDADTVQAFEVLAIDGETTVADLAAYLSISERQARTRIDRAGLVRVNGTVTR